MKTGTLFVSLFLAMGPLAALGQNTSRVSVNSAGVESNNGNWDCSISADGRFVAFSSYASNLVPNDTNGNPDPSRGSDIFVRDRLAGTTERVSVDSAGRQANYRSEDRTSISADGRFVAFWSYASNLVPGDTNGAPSQPSLGADVFVRDRQTGTTERVSVDSAGGQGNNDSLMPSMSADGRFVAFVSLASNFVPGDTNGDPSRPSSGADVFVHDRATGATTRVSVDSAGVEANIWNWDCSLSADGRFVAFTSAASSLVPNDTNGCVDVFVHDQGTGATARVSVDSAGAEVNYNFTLPSISADGRFVAFQTDAPNLVSSDTNGCADVFVHDRRTGTTERVSVNSAGVEGNLASAEYRNPSFSADGRFVAFVSLASNLVSGDTNGRDDIFVHDRVTGATVRASVDAAGGQGNFDSYQSMISADGRYGAFVSIATNLVAGDTNGYSDIFVRDLFPTTVTGAHPPDGSILGGDLVRIDGDGLASTYSIRFRNDEAVIVDVTAARVTVRTPAGIGTVDVSVLDSNGSTVVLASAFTYVEPEIAARYGTVNLGRGDRENVLLVNALAGDPSSREISIATGSPIQAVVLSPSSRATSRFAVYLWSRAPRASTRTPLPREIGSMVFAPPFLGGSPPVIWNNAGHARSLGVATMSSRPAPSTLFRTGGSPSAMTLTLQGLVEDDGSASPTGVSVTNAVIVRIS